MPLWCEAVEIHAFRISRGTGCQFLVRQHASHRRPGILLYQYGPKLNSLKYLCRFAFPNFIKIRLVVLKINLLKSAGYVMHQQFNIQQLYVLPTLYLCVLYLSENKQRLVPLTA